MKTWAWIVGGLGAAAAGYWWWRKQQPPEYFYPEGVIPGVTPGYPIAPSADQLPPDTEGAIMAAQSQAQEGSNASSSAFLEPSSSASSTKSSPSVATQSTLGKPSGGGSAGTSAKASTSSVKTTVVAYQSPVTSKTKYVAVPVSVPAKTSLVQSSTNQVSFKVPMSKPAVVLKPTPIRGVYAIGADHTEAEYRALAARAELESKRREWAANQMASQIAAIRRSY